MKQGRGGHRFVATYRYSAEPGESSKSSVSQPDKHDRPSGSAGSTPEAPIKRLRIEDEVDSTIQRDANGTLQSWPVGNFSPVTYRKYGRDIGNVFAICDAFVNMQLGAQEWRESTAYFTGKELKPLIVRNMLKASIRTRFPSHFEEVPGTHGLYYLNDDSPLKDLKGEDIGLPNDYYEWCIDLISVRASIPDFKDPDGNFSPTPTLNYLLSVRAAALARYMKDEIDEYIDLSSWVSARKELETSFWIFAKQALDKAANGKLNRAELDLQLWVRDPPISSCIKSGKMISGIWLEQVKQFLKSQGNVAELEKLAKIWPDVAGPRRITLDQLDYAVPDNDESGNIIGLISSCIDSWPGLSNDSEKRKQEVKEIVANFHYPARIDEAYASKDRRLVGRDKRDWRAAGRRSPDWKLFLAKLPSGYWLSPHQRESLFECLFGRHRSFTSSELTPKEFQSRFRNKFDSSRLLDSNRVFYGSRTKDKCSASPVLQLDFSLLNLNSEFQIWVCSSSTALFKGQNSKEMNEG